MPIAAKPQAFTIEDKLRDVLKIISEIRNPRDADHVREFIIDICTRYINKEKELTLHVPSNDFEIAYLEKVLQELMR